jgi:tRNA pseudouridine55 synthase
MATGLLILGIESATKLLTFLVGADKTYITTIRLGASTITDDREGDNLAFASAEALEALKAASSLRDAIEPKLAALRGDIMQVPSSVSAIKVNGERAYAKVRSGDEVKLAARPVNIARFEILGEPRLEQVDGHEFIDFEAIIDCSSGTYIRALARDLGEALGVGGHLTALRRTRIGQYSIAEASTAERLQQLAADGLALPILPAAEAAKAQFTVRNLSEQEVIDLRHGKRIRHGGEAGEPIAAIASNGSLIAMLTRSGKDLKSLVVFNDD